VSGYCGTGAEISRDGQLIAFTAVGERGQPAIAVCRWPEWAERKLIPAAWLWHWMPDSKALAYLEPRSRNLWVQGIDGGDPKQLTHFPADRQAIWDFDWSADGTRLAIARGRITSDIVMFRGLQRTH